MSTQSHKVCLISLLLATSAACGGGDEEGADPSGATGGGGAIDTGGSSSTGGAASQPLAVKPPDPGTPTGALASGDTDHEQIQGCWSKTACSASYAQLNDDFYATIDRAKAACLMMGLSARTAGIYLHNTASNSLRGQDATEHAFLVLGDGSVVHTSSRTTSGGQFAQQGTEGVTYTDAEKCELAASSYFDGCDSAVRATATFTFSDPGWTCLFSDPATVWLTNCQPVEPACE